MIRRRLTPAVALVAALLCGAALQPRAQAAGARPPIGSWRGTFHDGSTVELTLRANGDFMYGVPGQVPVVGEASWDPTSPAGGILTLTYVNAGFTSRAYFSVVWVSQNTLRFSDPYFAVTMQRI